MTAADALLLKLQAGQLLARAIDGGYRTGRWFLEPSGERVDGASVQALRRVGLLTGDSDDWRVGE